MRLRPGVAATPALAGLVALAGRVAVACGVTAVLLMAGVAVAGESAAEPGLGPRTLLPPWDAGLHPASWLVTLLLLIADGLGVLAVGLGLIAVREAGLLEAGLREAVQRPFRARRVALAGVAAVALLVVVPPLGSADHLSYAAYGRISAAGDDPYLVPPDRWHDGRDPVAGAVQPPWRSTPSVYGPVATAVQAVVAQAGGGSLRRTVWAWQLVAGAAFLAAAALLDRLARGDRAARARAAVIWTLNPLLLRQLVLGAHLDVLAAALALGVIAAARRRPLVAGLLLGAAAGTKLPYAVAGVAAAWALRGMPAGRRLRHLVLAAVGALAVLVPAHLWAGPHVFDQLAAAGRMVSVATPWRAVRYLAERLVGAGTASSLITPLAGLLAVWVAVRLARRPPWMPSPGGAAPPEPGPEPDRAWVGEASRAMVVLAGAWVLTAPYMLPWYDALVWAPLALTGGSWLDGVLLARLLTLAVAYVPGRVVGMSPAVETVTLGVRRGVAPLVAVSVLVIVWWRTREGAPGTGPGRAPGAEGTP